MRNGWFDANFILTVAALAMVSAIVGMIEPRLFHVVLLLDLWLLGYHHVVSTFTRLIFDRESFQQHRFLVIQLPLIVIAATVSSVLLFGPWVLPTVYLYWQWFHYTRQSYGIERIYRRKADSRASINDWVTTRCLYLVPLFGIVFRSYQQQPEFLGMSVRYLPTTAPVVWAFGGMAVVGLTAWLVQVVAAVLQGRLALAHTLYVISHHAIFLCGYLLIEDITIGWLVLNVWHNAQYILIVWCYNNNRFKNGVEEKHRFLSTISQSKNVFIYFLVCIGLSTIVYSLLGQASGGVERYSSVPITLTVFMMLNFHHYVVDGIIWKVRKPALRRNLGISS